MRSRGVTFDSCDVVVVPFPFTDRLAAKRRPALLVSSRHFNETHDECILAMIRSARNEWMSDIVLRDWREAGLNVLCKARLKLFTLDGRLILRRIGTLSRRDADATNSRLTTALALT